MLAVTSEAGSNPYKSEPNIELNCRAGHLSRMVPLTPLPQKEYSVYFILSAPDM
jgi:hypothetical protein